MTQPLTLNDLAIYLQDQLTPMPWPEAAALVRAAQAEIDRLTAENAKLLPMTVGWMYAYACNCVDEGIDIRKLEAPLILAQALAAITEKEKP